MLPYVAAGLFASDIYDDYLGPIDASNCGYHETWIVNVDVYIDTGEERYLERREYVYMLARNSPTERSGISVLPLIPVCTVTVSIGRRIV